MEDLRQTEGSPLDVPAGELWGRHVYDTAGHVVGTIDSIARTLGGSTRAIVRTSRRPHNYMFVELDEAVFDGGALVVPAAATTPSPVPPAPAAGFTWPHALRREG